MSGYKPKCSRKVISLFICLIMVFSLIFSSAEDVSAKSKKYQLPTKITYYGYNDGKYEKYYSDTLKYNKYKDLIKWGKGTTFSYKYWGNKKIKKRTMRSGSDEIIKYFADYYNKKGLCIKVGTEIGDLSVKYNKKNLPVKKVGDKQNGIYNTYTYKYYSNGSVKKMILKESDGYKWYYIFNKKGFLIKEKSKYSTYVYKYTQDKKGRITSVISYSVVDGKKKLEGKKVYSYSKGPKTTKKRQYMCMFYNPLIISEGIN